MQNKSNKSVDKDLELSNCDIEIQKYHMSMVMSLIIPFILAFASLGMAVDDNNIRMFFLSLSLILLFTMAGIIFADSSKLKKKYKQRKDLILNKYN